MCATAVRFSPRPSLSTGLARVGAPTAASAFLKISMARSKRTLSMDSSKERAIKDALQLFAEGRIKALIRAGWREANATERALGARLVRRTGELAGNILMQRGHLVTLDGAEFGKKAKEAKG